MTVTGFERSVIKAGWTVKMVGQFVLGMPVLVVSQTDWEDN